MESTIKEFDGDGVTLACGAVLDDFELYNVVLARYCAEAELYALKIISKRYVLAHQELERRLTEHAVLKRMARGSQDPFVVRLHWSFHGKESSFLAMDFHPGGTLAAQLVSKGGRFSQDATRFYATEIVEGCEGLHAAGVIYRNLQPENILIGADGHIVITLELPGLRRLRYSLLAPSSCCPSLYCS
ncbi:unnamed protein product [Rhizoctonia solani]|uniref:Protein kinase domain-containing protein n=1 Tax=Rhizoctonia solani TaxID=456999 RepID=A0A8H3E3G3_9AGAM|nr:unnamed protein product [Rhizoctonia solani]